MGHIFDRNGTYYADYEDPITRKPVQRSCRTAKRVANERLRQFELAATDPAAHAPKESLADALDYFTGACASLPAFSTSRRRGTSCACSASATSTR